MTFADIVHEVSRARRNWAEEFLWQRTMADARTDGQAKAAADIKCGLSLAWAEARYQVALSAISHGHSIAAELRRHGLANDPGEHTDQEPDTAPADTEAALPDCGD